MTSGNELIIQKRNLELLNMLESKCKGLENLLCKNVINIISKKIDSMEKRYSNKISNKNHNIQNLRIPEIPNADRNKITKLNNNIKEIENNFNNISTCLTSGDIINKKIEENYRLLDELEKTNRPIFTQSTEINKRFFIEDKIKEMEDKLSLLFSNNNINSKSVDNKEYTHSNFRQTDNETQRTANTIPFFNNNFPNNNLKPVSEKIDLEKDKEKKIKELYNKLNFTEKKIKNIAGNILKNF